MTHSSQSELTNALLNKGMNELTYPLTELMEAASKKVSVSIDRASLGSLKQSNYNMCFAKKVGNADYNVVWKSYQKFSVSNSFSWVPVYSIFGSDIFEESLKVKISCSPVTISLGQQTTLDEYGILRSPVTGGSNTAFTMINNYGSIHPGVNQLSTGIDGLQISTPIYVSPKPALSGATELSPVEKVMIWFEQDIETGTMFSTKRSRSIEVDLTFNKSIKLLYDGDWKVI